MYVCINWFRSYLSSRCFRVKYNNDFSFPHTCLCGVPQGSVLDPLLFVMYTTPLSTLVLSLSLNHYLYADDTTFSLLPSIKSQIAHLVMHHLVFGINFQIHSVSLTILVSIHLLIHFSTHLYHHPHSRHPSLLHSFTSGSKPTFSTNPVHRRFLLPNGLPHDNGTGPTYHAHHFIFSFAF